jgi:hydrogenase expression/formation protein HypE
MTRNPMHQQKLDETREMSPARSASIQNGKAEDRILLAHGGGGKMTRELVEERFLPVFNNPALGCLGDSAIIDAGEVQLAFTTDTFVVKPLFFPGGDIGRLAVCGTINDLAVCGARPIAISAGLVIEEGFPMRELDRILSSMAAESRDGGVPIVTGDTKVVERGGADGIFINTSGIGVVQKGLISPSPPEPGDAIIVNGTVGDHGVAVMAARGDLPVESSPKSDSAALHKLIFAILERFPGRVRFMRDATRGGLATVLCELADKKPWGIEIREEMVPVAEPVRALSDLLGLDPLYVANEGKAVFVVQNDAAGEVLHLMKTLPLGRDAAIIGRITAASPGRVILVTPIGGRRILDMLIGDQLPRIC